MLRRTWGRRIHCFKRYGSSSRRRRRRCITDSTHGSLALKTYQQAKQMLLCCEVALVCQSWFRWGVNWVANWFRSKVPISQRLRNFTDPYFSPVFAPFDSDVAPILLRKTSFNFFTITLDFDHPKTYITSKQTRIKALKSKLKQEINKKKNMD